MPWNNKYFYQTIRVDLPWIALDMLVIAVLLKKWPIFYGTMSTTDKHWSLFEPRNSFHSFCLRPVLIIPFHLCLCLPSSFLIWVFCISQEACPTTCPQILHTCISVYDIWWSKDREAPFLWTFLQLAAASSTLEWICSQTPDLYSSLNIRGQVPHLWRNRQNKVLYHMTQVH